MKKSLSRPRGHRLFPYKSGTKQALLIELLEKPGMTVEEVAKRMGCSLSYARRQIIRLHFVIGFGLVEEEDGRIYLFD